jgi:hypothetical protein
LALGKVFSLVAALPLYEVGKLIPQGKPSSLEAGHKCERIWQKPFPFLLRL